MKHEPIRPVRNMIEEQVFSRRWKELMGSKEPYESGMIGRVMKGYPYTIDQRAASVAASFVCWLGTNVGQSYMSLGRDIQEKTSALRTAYVAAWGAQNCRLFGHNSNARQIEFLTRSQADMDKDIFTEVSVKDLEAVEQVALWLGTDEGWAFVAGCEAEIARRQDLEALAFDCAAGRHDSPRARRIVDKFAITD